jgi:4-hydroxy-3-methylbut-2-enyl diphosphate reductase
LVEVATHEGARARLIEDAKGIDGAWLDRVQTVGLTAGASTPEPLVQATVEHLQTLGFGQVEQLRTADEHVIFPLPRELRAQPPQPQSRPPVD